MGDYFPNSYIAHRWQVLGRRLSRGATTDDDHFLEHGAQAGASPPPLGQAVTLESTGRSLIGRWTRAENAPTPTPIHQTRS